MEEAGSPADRAAELDAQLCSLSLDCSTDIPDEPKVECSFRVEEADGTLEYEGPAGVEVRGRSSQGFPKKQYALELWTEDGRDRERDLLAMGDEEDWVLNGAYIDRALLRNKFGFDLYREFRAEAGGYAPESRFCWLVLDGSDWGVYFLTERVKRDPGRVPLPEDDGTGSSFLVKLDDSGGIFEDSSMGYGSWRLIYPRQDEASGEQVAAVQAWLGGWRDAVLGDDPDAIFDWVDLDSAVDFVLLEEFLKNNDAYYLSVHLWKEPGGRLRFVPWDLDLTLGQPLYNDNSLYTEWILYRPEWVAAMARSGRFHEALEARWAELRAGPLAEDAVLDRLHAYEAVVAEVVDENFAIWPFDEIQFGGDQLPVVCCYDSEIERVEDWVVERLAWMDEQIAGY